MADFSYEARGRGGEVRKGRMTAESEDVVAQRLRAQQLNPVAIKRVAFSFDIQLTSGVSQKDLVTFSRLFSTMIDAGLPIVQCLDILQGQSDNPRFAAVLRDIKSAVEEGSTFSDALGRHPRVFDALFVNLVRAGEIGGILDSILNRLALYNEKSAKLKRQLRGAMVYPTAVLIIFMGVMCVLLGYVIPSFKTIFKDLGSKEDLPWLTKAVIAASEAFVSNIGIVIALAVVAVVAAVVALRKRRFQRLFHLALMRIPIIGPVLQKIAVARFTRTLGTLLSSGVTIMDALEVVAKTAGNVVVEDAITYARQRVSEGRTLAEPLAESAVFPPMVVQMVGVGEQTGALDAMLTKIAEFYESEVDVAVSALTSLIEPVMMVGIGATVGVVLIAMYMPIFSIAGRIKGD